MAEMLNLLMARSYLLLGLLAVGEVLAVQSIHFAWAISGGDCNLYFVTALDSDQVLCFKDWME